MFQVARVKNRVAVCMAIKFCLQQLLAYSRQYMLDRVNHALDAFLAIGDQLLVGGSAHPDIQAIPAQREPGLGSCSTARKSPPDRSRHSSCATVKCRKDRGRYPARAPTRGRPMERSARPRSRSYVRRQVDQVCDSGCGQRDNGGIELLVCPSCTMRTPSRDDWIF